VSFLRIAQSHWSMPMKWKIVAPFFRADEANGWIDDYAPPSQHKFQKVLMGTRQNQQNWHQRASRNTPFANWADYWQTSGSALREADGVITLFPQLAATTSIRRVLSHRRNIPIVAWCFNIGRFHHGMRQSLARAAFEGVERFIVHSTAEVTLISEYLSIPRERVQFVPLQRARIESLEQEDKKAPFAVAMGSANRDYVTLVEAARITGLSVTIVASDRCVEKIALPPNVTFVTDLSARQCHVLAQRARLSIVPLADSSAASGQVTVIEAQRMGRPVIATNTIGTRDYIDDGKTGLLVKPGDPKALADAMISLWHDEEKRAVLARGGEAFAEIKLSDEAAGQALIKVLNDFG
jgi:glycosyltransferase involved in cell wall biosynthesis